MTDVVTSLALLIVVAIAARRDLIEHRIPNVLTIGALGCALLAQSIFGGMSGFLNASAGAGVGLACFLPLYLGKGMGAGDLKLMGAVGAFLGPVNALIAAALALVFGSVAALGIVIWRLAESRAAVPGLPSRQGSATGMSLATMAGIRKERFPYAVAIGLGAITTLWLAGALDIFLHGVNLR